MVLSQDFKTVMSNGQISRKIIIRLAQPGDASVVARLMYYASPNQMLSFFGRPENKAIGVLQRMFRLPYHITSYTHTFVAEGQGGVVGSLSGFDERSWRTSSHASWIYAPVWFAIVTPRQISRMIAAFANFNRIFLPISDGEYYIGHLAVLPEKRGHGIGRQLIKFAENQARVKGLKGVALDVEVENERARRLYEDLGFQTIKVVADESYCKRFNSQGEIRMMKFFGV